MKKLILIKLDLQDAREKRKALKTVSALSGIDEISMDMKGKKLTIIGTVDPVSVVSKLRKFWWTEILIVGPAKEPAAEKKEETKKEEPKKEEEIKKEEPPKEEPKKEDTPKEEAKKEEPPKEEGKKDKLPKEETKKEDPKKDEEDDEDESDYEDEEEEEVLKKLEEVKRSQPQPRPQLIMPLPQPYPPAAYRPYYPPPMHTYNYQVHHSIEENPNACTIC